MKIWAKTAEYSEGKYLVVRRDGTIPAWPHFVIGAADPCAPGALIAYANEAEAVGLDPAFVASVRERADDFRSYAHDHAERARAGQHKGADPDAPPHRRDNPAVIAMIRGQGDLSTYATDSEQPRAERERVDQEAARVLQRVLDYNDRTSPEDWPEALLITGDELISELNQFADAILRDALLSAPVVDREAVEALRDAAHALENGMFSAVPLSAVDAARAAVARAQALGNELRRIIVGAEIALARDGDLDSGTRLVIQARDLVDKALLPRERQEVGGGLSDFSQEPGEHPIWAEVGDCLACDGEPAPSAAPQDGAGERDSIEVDCDDSTDPATYTIRVFWPDRHCFSLAVRGDKVIASETWLHGRSGTAWSGSPQELLRALSRPSEPEAAQPDVEALRRYRAATHWIGADAWDGCSDCMARLRWAASYDTGREMSADEIAEALRPFFSEHSPTEAAQPAAGVVEEIAAERRRQVEVEGWTPEHDDRHGEGKMARAASCYASLAGQPDYVRETFPPGKPQDRWPWEAGWFKPKNRRRDLIRAGALIVAEIDRLDRLAALSASTEQGRTG